MLTETSFTPLGLSAALLGNLPSLGYERMTPIQAQSLPHILAGKDVIAQAKTGSGKTAAFGLGLLDKLNARQFSVQSLVLCPTRELANQVATEIRRLARTTPNVKVLTLCGGAPFGAQAASIASGAHIVIGTPGRIEDHLRKNKLNLDTLNTLVLDEADRMLDMGFQETLDAIVEHLPQQRQTLLFSATFPADIESMVKRVMHDPVRVQVDATHDETSIKQRFFNVQDSQRIAALQTVLLHYAPESAVVFCNTKLETQRVADALCAHGFSAMALHGDFEQRERNQILVRFANKSASIMVATDVAARGLDIDALDAVINFHIATTPEVHLHRIGRTGRAGSTGLALTFCSERDGYKLALLQDYIGRPLECEALPANDSQQSAPLRAAMATLQIDAGKRQKIRPGDILGALTGEHGIAGSEVGKIDIFENFAYVAVGRGAVKAAVAKLATGKLKGRSCRVRLVS